MPQMIVAPPAERTLQGAKIRAAVIIEYNGLAIENGGCYAKLFGCRGDGGEAVGPVMAAAGDDPHALRLNVDCQSIAIQLHLVEPIRPDGHSRLQQCKAGLDARRHRIEGQTGLVRIALADRTRLQR